MIHINLIASQSYEKILKFQALSTAILQIYPNLNLYHKKWCNYKVIQIRGLTKMLTQPNNIKWATPKYSIKKTNVLC